MNAIVLILSSLLVCPQLPEPNFADTEVSTNIPILEHFSSFGRLFGNTSRRRGQKGSAMKGSKIRQKGGCVPIGSLLA